MKKPSLYLLASVPLVLSAGASAQCSSLVTYYSQNNFGSPGGQIFFDANVTNGSGIYVTAIDTNCNAAIGVPVGIEVYTIPGTYLGNETNAGAWTLVSSGSGVCAGTNQPTAIDLTDFSLPPGNLGVALVMTTPTSHTYTNGVGSNQNYATTDLMIMCGSAQNVPWNAPHFTPRVWNGEIYYCPASGPPVVYCSPGTTSNGCNATISASGNPNVAHNAPCTISIANVDGQRTGIVFYSLQALPQSWCPAGGGSSFLCVKPPTMRSGTQGSGGSLGLCDGALALDWNAFQLANPGALGAPWSAGDKAFVQGWFRDPPSCKTTSLSDAVELTYAP